MELAEHLIKDLGVSTKQAEGGAGLLLEYARQQLSADEFVKIARTIPAISDVIGKAPRPFGRPVGPLRARLSRWFGGLGGLTALVSRFEILGCEKTMIRRFADSLIRFFREKGGEEIATLLRGVLR